MTILGISPVGTLPLTDAPHVTSANPSPLQAAGVGVARSMAVQLGGVPFGVAGIGRAGSLVATTTMAISGVAGIGIARAALSSPSVIANPATGTGTVGSIVKLIGVVPISAFGFGTVGQIQLSNTAGTVIGVAGTGVAGQIGANPGVNLRSAVGIGAAGIAAVMVSGGGSSERLPRDRRKTGFERVNRRYEPVVTKAPEKPPAVIPPSRFVSPPLRPPKPAGTPIPLPPSLMPNVSTLADSIRSAEDAYRMRKVSEEQDANDIAEVLAFLDAQENA